MNESHAAPFSPLLHFIILLRISVGCRGSFGALPSKPWLGLAVAGLVVAYPAGVRLPMAGVVAWFAAGNRGSVRQCSGEWSPT